MLHRKILLLGLLIFAFSYKSCFAQSGLSGDFANSLKAKNFISLMVKQHKFNRGELNKLFSKVKKRQDILEKYQKPKKNIAEYKKTFDWYQGIFITEENIKKGKKFMQKHKKHLNRAEKKYGVPAEYIAGIIGIETKFGKHLGKDRVIDALATIAFYFPKRSKYFTSELKNFLLLTRSQKIKATKPKGSYAGAMGYGQFMPSSYRTYAVDFNNDGKKDLWNEIDAIGSVANYLKKKGWKWGQNAMTGKDGNGNKLSNFKIIKRYNNSDRYAKVVHILAQKIK